jgi:hypothetical protein
MVRPIAISIWVTSFALVAFLVGGGLLLSSSICKTYACSDDVWRAYTGAAQHWLQRAPLYTLRHIDQFQYFPQAAMVLVPFRWMGVVLGGVVWRAVAWALYASAAWRVTRLFPDESLFTLVSLLLLGPAAMSLLSGQTNLPLAAATLHAAVELGRSRHARATAWLMLALALKPIALVPILLALVQYPRMRLPLLLGVILFLLSPFATAPAGYVVEQYRACLDKLALSSQPDRHFEEIRGLLWKLGSSIPNALLLALQLVAALGGAALSLVIRRRWREPFAAVMLYAVAAAYLMLFNPRTQPNSFVIIAPAAAVPAALFLVRRRILAALPLILMLICWSGAARFAEFWLKPLASLAFAILLVREIFTPRWLE